MSLNKDSPISLIAVDISSTPGVGHGVWSSRYIQANTILGSTYGMPISEDKSSFLLDIKPDVSNLLESNWMKFVRCTKDQININLMPFEYKESIFYKVVKPIPPGTELLVDYVQKCQDVNYPSDKNKFLDSTWFKCEICNIKIPSLIFVMKHAMFCNKRKCIAVTVDCDHEADVLEQIQPYSADEAVNEHKYNYTSEENINLMQQCTLCREKINCECLLNKRVKSEQNDLNNIIECTEILKLTNVEEGENKINIHPYSVDEAVNEHNHNVCRSKENISLMQQCTLCREKINCECLLNKKVKLEQNDLHNIIGCTEIPKFTNAMKEENKILNSNYSENVSPLQRSSTSKAFYERQLFECNGCGNLHASKSILTKHIFRCNKSFLQLDCLKQHSKNHSGKMQYHCDVCKKYYNYLSSLKKHMRTHTGEKPYECNVCNISFSHSYKLKIHTRTHTGENPYECNVCHKSFSQSYNFKIHTRTHTGEKPYQCTLCNKSFFSKSALKFHARTHTGEKPYECNACHKSFPQSSALKRHTMTHTGENPYQCNVCHKSFSRLYNLQKHTIIHTGEKPYECNVCHKSFSQSYNFKIHTRTHTGEKPYQCTLCNKSFLRKSTLKLHARTHTGEKPYECNVCHKSFSEAYNLKLHTMTHTGKNPYQCNVCHKSFSRLFNLQKHTIIHTGEKPYQCNVCKKSFSRSDKLKIHIRTHTGEKPYQCYVCKKSFSEAHDLKLHTRRHTGEKPYECNVCHKSFSQSSALKRHTRTHTGEKPYKCDVCHKSFSRLSGIKNHTRLHTGENSQKDTYGR